MDKPVTFITGNKGKLAEVQAHIPFVIGKSFDLPEIQDVDPKKIIKEKLRAAIELCDGPVMVDDTALCLECFENKKSEYGLPGPLIKWFLQTITNEGLATMAIKLGKTAARASTIIGYADKNGNVSFFEGTVNGIIVLSQGTSGFGWDHIFVPSGFEETFAKMGIGKKNKISPRALAVEKFKCFLSRSD